MDGCSVGCKSSRANHTRSMYFRVAFANLCLDFWLLLAFVSSVNLFADTDALQLHANYDNPSDVSHISRGFLCNRVSSGHLTNPNSFLKPFFKNIPNPMPTKIWDCSTSGVWVVYAALSASA